MVSHLHIDIDFAAVFDVEFVDIGAAQHAGDAARNPLQFDAETLELIAVELDLQLATAAVHTSVEREQTRDAIEPPPDLVGHLSDISARSPIMPKLGNSLPSMRLIRSLWRHL